MNRKRITLTIISILLILPISFIFANMSEAALTYSVKRGDILIGAFVVFICILIRFGIDRVLVRLIEEEQEKESDEAEKVVSDVRENEIEDSDGESDTELETDHEEDTEDYDEKAESIIGSLFKNIIIYVIAATLMVVILFLYSIEWISLVLATTGITFLSIVLLEKNIYRKRKVAEQTIESDELDDLDDEIDVESDNKTNDESVEDSAEKLPDKEKSDEVEKPADKDDANESEKTDKAESENEATESSENKEETEVAENTDNLEKTGDNENTSKKGKKKKRNRKRNRNVADRIKKIQAEEKIIRVDEDDIELTFVETKIADNSDEPTKNEPVKEDIIKKEKNKPAEEENKKEGLEFISVDKKKEEKESTDIENDKKKDEASDVDNSVEKSGKEPDKGIETTEKVEKEEKPDKEEVIENTDEVENTDVEENPEPENTDETKKKEVNVGKVVFAAILQTIAYLLPIILIMLVFGDIQAKHFAGPYFMLVIVISILTAGFEVATRDIPVNKVAYIITSIFLTLFLCHRSILIGLFFLLAAYLILVIIPISYENWGTGGTKAVNRAKISMSLLVSRVFSLIMIVLAVWQLGYGAMWEIDYLVILSVAVCSIGYMADRYS